MQIVGEQHANDAFLLNGNLLASGNGLFWTVSEAGKFVSVSMNVQAVTGFTVEEVCQGGTQLWLHHVHPEDAAKVGQAYETLFGEGRLFELDYRFRCKNGLYQWAHDRALALYKKEGEKIAEGIIAFTFERNEGEIPSRSLEQFARFTLDALPSHIAILDQTGPSFQ